MRMTMGMTMGMRAGHTSGNRTTSDSGSGNAWYCYLIVISFTDEGRPPHYTPRCTRDHTCSITAPSRIHLPCSSHFPSELASAGWGHACKPPPFHLASD